MPDHPLQPLSRLDGVPEAVAAARAACEELRWHRALRRRWAVARTEAGVRCARDGAVVDGVRLPLDVARDVARGASEAPAGPDGAALLGALRVQAELEHLMAPPGSTGVGTAPPFGQLLTRLHSLAVGSSDPATAGRLRSDDQPGDLRGLGVAPTGAELAARLDVLGSVVAAPAPRAAPEVPALVRAAVVHGELLVLRPFARGNGAVARGMFRHLVTSGGVDPVGVLVPEALWAEQPMGYVSAAAGFAVGTPEGLAGWVRYCAQSVVRGAQEGTVVADAVLAGRLGEGA